MAKSVVSAPIRAARQATSRRLAFWRHGDDAQGRVWVWRPSPVRWFQLASFVVILLGMLGAGWWLNSQIELRVIEQTVNVDAAFIQSFVAPLLHDYRGSTTMSPSDVVALDGIFHSTLLDDRIVAVCLWARSGRVLYSSEPAKIGEVYSGNSDLLAAFSGRSSWEMGTSDVYDSSTAHDTPRPENPDELLSVYSPIRHYRAGPIIAVAEFFLAAAPLYSDIAAAQQQTWVAVSAVGLVIYLLLAGFVQSMSNTLVRQKEELSSQVVRLKDLLLQNQDLRVRIRQATRRAVMLNERVLRAIGADLHDGPAQYLTLASLHLDRVAPPYHKQRERQVGEHLAIVQSSVGQAIQEIRAIATGLGMPQLEALSLSEVITLAATTHERTYHTQVSTTLKEMPEHADLSIKTTLYRVIQEGLTNAYHHGRGIDERIAVAVAGDTLMVEISDRGPGFEVGTTGITGITGITGATSDTSEHLGLMGMRARVESLGGTFAVRSAPGLGTRIHIQLPLSDGGESE